MAISPITTLVNDLGYVLCAAIGCIWAIAGKLAVGNVQAMPEYTRKFAEPFSSLAGMAGSIGAAAAAGERIFSLLDAPEEEPDTAVSHAPETHEGSVVFRNVQFGYSPDRMLMKDVNLTVKPGQKVAVVGPTGAGKTTLINLLMRFYELNKGSISVDGVDIKDMTRAELRDRVAVVGPTGAGKTTLINLLMRFYELNKGSISVDGVDIKDMTRAELRDRFGMVLQDTWLFEGTIGENIGYAEENMSREKIISASKSACSHSFVKTLPGGYDMILSKGAENISQGERQLLTIARAIASDPEIMILDEATSNVDTHTEVLIQKAKGAENISQGERQLLTIARAIASDPEIMILDEATSNVDTHTEVLIQKAMAELMKGRTSFVLLTIARAIASDPEIMILDEATSNVDTHTEVLIQKAMAELMKGRTSFVIAHRLSTIRDADMILYMEDGDIKEIGTHDELMAKNGKYAALYLSQFA